MSPIRNLAPRVHAATFGRDLILLDEISGSYDLIAGATSTVHLSSDRRALSLDDPDSIDALEALDIFARLAPTSPVRSAVVPRRSALHGGEFAPLHARDWCWMTFGWMRMVLGFYGRPFGRLIRRRRPRLADHGNGAEREARVLSKARTFDRLSVWTPFAGDCFFRCYMLIQMLGRDGWAVDWVFGVRTWPFLAHCWLQYEDVVLTDPAETVELFSTVLVV